MLKQNFSVGKTYEFNVTSDQILDQEEPSQNQSLNQHIGTRYLFQTLSDSAEYKLIKVVYKQIVLRSSTKGSEVDYNSDLDTLGRRAKFGNLRNESFTMVFSPDGSVKSTAGLDQIVTHLAVKMAADSTEIPYYQNNLSKQFNADVIRETLESSFRVYPGKPVKVGDSWTIDTKIQMSIPVENKTTYTLKEVKSGKATLTVRGTLLSKGAFVVAGKNTQTDLKGSNTGELILDLNTGAIISSHLRVDFFGKIDGKYNFEMEAINEITGREL